ncbi:MAG: hypothetical protein ACTSPY_17690 [Candidatus Helarchaeota archaeon]
MSNINQLLSAYMDNIIQLLQNLVKSVQENNVLLKKNQQLLVETYNLIGSLSGSENFSKLSESLQEIVGQLQKGVQVFQLSSMLEDIKKIMDKMGVASVSNNVERESEETSVPSSEITQEFKAELKTAPKKDDDEDHLIKPSSFL